MDKTIISFPGLGIEPFEIAREAFSIGNFAIYWLLQRLLLSTGVSVQMDLVGLERGMSPLIS